MSLTKHLQDGGIPNGWTAISLAWLAETHRLHAKDQHNVRPERASWHRRWAALIEDVLETRRVHHH